jgi:predicted nucleic acid-binding protein
MMSSSPRIYFDACCFVDLARESTIGEVETGRDDHVWYCRKFLEAHRGGDVIVYTSTLSVAECTHIKDSASTFILTDEVKNRFRAFLLSGKAVNPVQPTPKILDAARDITWTHAIRAGSADRIHLATAIQMNCEVFLTTDGPLLKRSAEFKTLGIKVCTADDAKDLLPTKYKQLPLKHLPESVTAAPGA